MQDAASRTKCLSSTVSASRVNSGIVWFSCFGFHLQLLPCRGLFDLALARCLVCTSTGKLGTLGTLPSVTLLHTVGTAAYPEGLLTPTDGTWRAKVMEAKVPASNCLYEYGTAIITAVHSIQVQ